MTSEHAVKHDLETLRRFNRKVARLEASGFAKRYAEDIPNVVAKFEQPKFKDCGRWQIRNLWPDYFVAGRF